MASLEYCIGNHQVVLPDLLDSPLLVGVHHELPVPTDGLSHDGTPPDVILHIRPNLQLEIVEPVSHELLAELDDLLLRVSQPAGGRGVGGQARAQHLLLPGGLQALTLSEQVQGLSSGDAVLNVAAVEISK